MESRPSPETVRRGTASSRVAELWPYAVLLALGIAILTPQLGTFGLWDPWEPKYAESAREMAERGSYIVPYYRDEVRLTKPILVYWGILAGASVFGMNELGARAVGVTLAILTMLAVYYGVSLLRGRRAGLISACVLGTTPYFYFQARQAMPDVYLLTSSGWAVLFLCLGLFGPDRRRDLHFAISYLGFALAFLAKGPMIIGTIYGVSLAVYLVACIDFRRLLSTEHRGATLRAAVTAAAAAGLLLFAVPTAFLFGTSQNWWGYSDEKREQAAEFRSGLGELLQGYRLPELGLFVALGASLWVLARLRRAGRLSVRTAIAPVALGAAALTGTFTDASTRTSLASLLMAILAAVVLWRCFRNYVHRPGLWPGAERTLGLIGRQLLLFGLVMLVVAGPWHFAILFEQGAGYFTDFILKHNVERAADKINQTGASDFYLQILTFGFFPWSAFLAVAVAWLVDWRDRNPFLKHGPEAFLLIYVAVTYAAFAIPATKFPHYLSPITIPVAVLIGITVHRMLESRTASATMAWIVATLFYLLPMRDMLADEGIRRLVGTFSMKRFVPTSIEPGTYFAILLVSIAVLLAASVVFRARLLVAGVVLSAALVGIYHNAVFIPRLSVHKTMKALCEVWREHGQPNGEPIAFQGSMKHGIFFYTDFEIEVLRGKSALAEFMNPRRRAFAIVEKADFPKLRERVRTTHRDGELHLIEDSHFQYVLVSNRAIDRSSTGD